jgi:ketosteroid isomerase-like protein
MGVIVEAAESLTIEEQSNIEIVRSLYRRFLEGDLEGVVGSMATNVRIVGSTAQRAAGGPHSEAPEYTGSYSGREQAATLFTQFQRLVQYQEPLAPVLLRAKGNRVLAIGADRRKHSVYGDEHFGGSAKTMIAHWTMIWTLEQGIVTELRVVEDAVPADSY